MEKAELLELTDIEVIKEQYRRILGERVNTDGSHPLYNKGVFDGMEIILTAISISLKARKRITDETTL